MLAEFSIFPLDGLHLSKDIATVVEVLDATGLDYRLGPVGTCIEGDQAQVIAAIQRCHQAVAANHERVITTIVIDDRKAHAHPMAEMVPSVEKQLDRRVPRLDMDEEC